MGSLFFDRSLFTIKVHGAVHVSWEFSQDSVKKATFKVRSLVYNVIFD